MPKKFCCYFSLKIGSIVIGTITTILCAAWLGYNLHQYFQTIKLQELHIIEVKVVLSATIFIISVTEIFGAYMENDWLILPWLLVCGSGLAISPLILFLMVLVNLNIIFSIIGYAISLYWWLCVLYYYQQLSLQNEENVLNRFFGKFCEALSLIDVYFKLCWSWRVLQRSLQEN